MMKMSKKKHMMNMNRNKRKNTMTWTLQVAKVHQGEESIHHKAKEEMQVVKHQKGHHDKPIYLKGINTML